MMLKPPIGMDLPPEDLPRILGGNLARLLKLSND